MPRSHPFARALAVVAVAITTLAVAAAAPPHPLRPATSRSPSASATSPTSPTPPALVGVEDGIFEERLGDNVTLETATFNAGPAAIEALFSGAIDATYIGPNPAINALRAVQGRGDPHRLRRRPRAARSSWSSPEINERRGPQGQEDRHAAARQHPGRRARAWLKEQGPRDRHHGRRRRLDRPAGERADARRPSSRATSTAPGCPSRGRPASSTRAAARSSSTSATCGPTASSSPPTSSCAPSSSRSTPTS